MKQSTLDGPILIKVKETKTRTLNILMFVDAVGREYVFWCRNQEAMMTASPGLLHFDAPC